MTPPRHKIRSDEEAASFADFTEEEIIFGSIAPGAELVEDAMMERFHAKRHIIRAMLQELVGRGIVEKERGRSARVKSFTPTEVDELYHMRAALHREAVRIMPLPVSLGDLRNLRAAQAEYEAAIEAGAPPIHIHRLNDAFHTQLFAFCRNSLLCEMIAMLNRRSAPIRSHGIVEAEWLTQARREHRLMIDALERGDRDTLSTLTVDHMMPTRHIWEATHVQPPSKTRKA
ncbi:GntR family transcriptional regulator [Paracoccus aerodenitrificans]|uniref:GntR family transcriptional regulator n=1 Tax=Paracoccus aerodenitrificans TaxID=3017781 RepID=UPI0022F06B81|nr:GntR family transcriptional regulator [Paracoccus aerodenitrificans]WBU62471.1 GntR family transcriptional regulator [Paracoccus aerodenitrificans]